jgi:hypothetical protein
MLAGAWPLHVVEISRAHRPVCLAHLLFLITKALTPTAPWSPCICCCPSCCSLPTMSRLTSGP